MTSPDDALAANAAYADTFAAGALRGAPARRLAVVTCMDARIDSQAVLGLDLGDANVLRTAGGVVTDAVLHDLVVSQRKLGTREVMVVQHTGCGMRTFTDDELRAEVAADTGEPPQWPAEVFGAEDDDVRAAVRRVRGYAPLPHRDDVRGFVYDVATGRLREVDVPA